MAVLKVIRGPAAQPEYKICADRTVLGRDRSCDIWMKRQEVSRKHVAFVRTIDGYEIADCGSHNGTKLNGEWLVPHQHHRLENHDLVQVGTFVFSFLYDATDVSYGDESSEISSGQIFPDHQLSPTKQKTVDVQCDRFEASWQVGEVPRIDDYLQAWQGPLYVDQRRKLLHELVLIDFEYRWRQGSTNSDRQPGQANVDQSAAQTAGPGRLPSHPLLEDYVARHPELESEEHEQLQLIATEYRLRQQWGDRPRYLDYRSRFPRMDHRLEATLRKIALKLSPTTVRIYHQRQLVLSRKFSGPLEIGRQKAGEPPPYVQLPSGDVSRIIIAAAQDQTISRNHLYLDIVARHEILVENRSTKSYLFVSSDERLSPGENRYLNLPVDISLGSKAVRLA